VWAQPPREDKKKARVHNLLLRSSREAHFQVDEIKKVLKQKRIKEDDTSLEDAGEGLRGGPEDIEIPNVLLPIESSEVQSKE
jgi:hypothetical protein